MFKYLRKGMLVAPFFCWAGMAPAVCTEGDITLSNPLIPNALCDAAPFYVPYIVDNTLPIPVPYTVNFTSTTPGSVATVSLATGVNAGTCNLTVSGDTGSGVLQPGFCSIVLEFSPTATMAPCMGGPISAQLNVVPETTEPPIDVVITAELTGLPLSPAPHQSAMSILGAAYSCAISSHTEATGPGIPFGYYITNGNLCTDYEVGGNPTVVGNPVFTPLTDMVVFPAQEGAITTAVNTLSGAPYSCQNSTSSLSGVLTLNPNGNGGGNPTGVNVYCSPSALDITGALLISGGPGDMFIFIAPGGITEVGPVTLTGGILAANVYWVSGSGVTLEGNMVGNVIAQSSVTFTTSLSTLTGRALAQTGDVTFSQPDSVVVPPN